VGRFELPTPLLPKKFGWVKSYEFEPRLARSMTSSCLFVRTKRSTAVHQPQPDQFAHRYYLFRVRG